MQRKSIFTILGVMLAVVVTSLTLVFAVGPMVSADDENDEPKIGLLDKAEYFNITYEDYNDELGYAPVVLSGLSLLGDEYIGRCDYVRCENFDKLCVVVPDGVTEIRGFTDWPYGYYTYFGAFSYFNSEEKGQYYYNYATYAVTSVILPDTLRVINFWAFYGSQIESIILPANITTIGYNPNYYGVDSIFCGCNNLTTIYCECSQEFAQEHWNPSWKGDCDARVVWNCNKTITFNTNGGNETITDQTVCVDHYAVAPETPTRENYVFRYWYTTDENTPFDFENEQVTDNMTLTAKWEAVVTQNNENQNQENNQNNETANNEVASAEKKFNPLMAWIGGGIAAGLSVICGVAIVVAKKRRK